MCYKMFILFRRLNSWPQLAGYDLQSLIRFFLFANIETCAATDLHRTNVDFDLQHKVCQFAYIVSSYGALLILHSMLHAHVVLFLI